MNDAIESTSPDAAPTRWFAPTRFALMLAAALGGVFWKILFAGESLFYRDYSLLGYPFAWYHRECFWRGELPFWNPLINCGAPFLAQWNTLTLYPGALIYLLLPMPWSLGFFCVAHLFLGGMGLYFLARRWTGSTLAAAVAGVAFTFNGLVISSHIYPNYLVALGWMPWVTLAAQRAWREGGRRLVPAALAGAMQMLSGAPEIILLTWLLAATLMFFESGGENETAALFAARMKRFTAIAALVAGLAAVQLLPFFDLLAQSQRGGTSFGGQFWAMPGWGFANFLAPLFHCGQTIQGLFVQSGQSFYPSYYPGAAVLGLALLAVVVARDQRVWLLATATIFAVLLAMGDNGPLFPLLKTVAPALGIARYPIKLVTLAAFTLPLLAAFGVRSWMDREAGPAPAAQFRLIWAALLLALAAIAFTGWRFPFGTDGVRAFLENTFARAGLLALTGGALLLVRREGPLSRLPLISGALVLLVVVDLAVHKPQQLPSFSSDAFAPRLLQASQRVAAPPAPGQGRMMVSPQAERFFNTRLLPDFLQDFLGARLAQWYALNLLDGLPKVNGPSTLQLREELEVEALFYARTNAQLPRLMDFLGVTHVTAPTGLMDWQPRPSALPLVTAGQKPAFASPAETLRALESETFAPLERVILPAEAQSMVKPRTQVRTRILNASFASDRVEAEVESEADTLLVIAQTYSPSWRATVDGRPARLWRANHAFQCLEVPAGRHRVLLAYRERSFPPGAIVSGAALAVCAGLWWRKRHWRGIVAPPRVEKPDHDQPG